MIASNLILNDITFLWLFYILFYFQGIYIRLHMLIYCAHKSVRLKGCANLNWKKGAVAEIKQREKKCKESYSSKVKKKWKIKEANEESRVYSPIYNL